MKLSHHNLLLIILFIIIFTACKKEKPGNVKDTAKISLKFEHLVEGQPVKLDTLCYINAAGNKYSISDVMYFISEVRLYKSDGSVRMISDWKEIHYVDEEIPETKTWYVYDKIETGNYDSVGFVFGIRSEKNKSFMFVNPPEVNMMWPDILGGGYHYLMINGFWINNSNQSEPYNFHMGIGQIYKNNIINTDSILGYVDNSFTVILPASSFSLVRDEIKEINIQMNIESWFKTPHIYDHNYWGGAIMQIQAAMQMAKENGWDVFTVDKIF